MERGVGVAWSCPQALPGPPSCSGPLPLVDPTSAGPLLAGSELAAVLGLGLGLGLGLLVLTAAVLLLLLHCKACRLLPANIKTHGERLLPPAACCLRAKTPLTSRHSLFPPPQGETASGPPSKRSTLMPTVPWPRSERCRWGG